MIFPSVEHRHHELETAKAPSLDHGRGQPHRLDDMQGRKPRQAGELLCQTGVIPPARIGGSLRSENTWTEKNRELKWGRQALERKPFAALDLVQKVGFAPYFVNMPFIPGFALVSRAAIWQNPLPYWESAASSLQELLGVVQERALVECLIRGISHDASPGLQASKPDAICSCLDLRPQPTQQSVTR